MSIFDFRKPSSVTVIPETAAPLLDLFRLDAATAIAWSFPGGVSRHPVQSGREGIVDAVQIDPDVLQVTGVITDTPLAFDLLITEIHRASAMSDLLIKLRAQRRPMKILTSWTGALSSRWISSFTLTRNTASGGQIEVTMTIEKTQIVRTQIVPSLLDADVQLLGVSTVTVGEY